MYTDNGVSSGHLDPAIGDPNKNVWVISPERYKVHLSDLRFLIHLIFGTFHFGLVNVINMNIKKSINLFESNYVGM